MNPQTEAHLVKQIRTNNLTALHAFVTAHYGMVFDLAKKHGTPEEYEEYVGEGSVALCEGAKNFAHAGLECRFSTYIHTRIKRAMITHRRTSGTVQGSEWKARTSKQARKVRDWAEQEIGETLTAEEVAYIEQIGDPSVKDVQRQSDNLESYRFIDLDEWDERHDASINLFGESFSVPFNELPLTTRVIFQAALQCFEQTGNASLSIMADLPVMDDITRDEIHNELCAVWGMLKSKREDHAES